MPITWSWATFVSNFNKTHKINAKNFRWLRILFFTHKLCYKGEFTTETDDNSYFYFFSPRSLLLKQVPTDYSINCTEWIIQQINVSIHVQGPGQTDPCPLTSAQADPSVSYHGAVSIRHHFYVLNIEQFILLLYK